MVDIKMPIPVEFALSRLHSNGYEASDVYKRQVMKLISLVDVYVIVL